MQQVPFVAVEILENGDGAVVFFGGFAAEGYTALFHGLIIASEIVGVKEEKDASAGLIADAGFLFVSFSFGEQEASSLRIVWGDENPALSGEWSVFDEIEAEGFCVEGNGFVVVFDEESDVADVLGHFS